MRMPTDSSLEVSAAIGAVVLLLLVLSIVGSCRMSGRTAGSANIGPGAATSREPEAAFLAENGVAMSRMMDEMSVRPSGDVDRDFVAMMVPHHEGAVRMARAVLRYGRNEQIRRLAQEIIVTQSEEIAAMHFAVAPGDEVFAGTPRPPEAADGGRPGSEVLPRSGLAAAGR